MKNRNFICSPCSSKMIGKLHHVFCECGLKTTGGKQYMDNPKLSPKQYDEHPATKTCTSKSKSEVSQQEEKQGEWFEEAKRSWRNWKNIEKNLNITAKKLHIQISNLDRIFTGLRTGHYLFIGLEWPRLNLQPLQQQTYWNSSPCLMRMWA